MPGEDIQSWSVTAANNGNSDSSIEWREGQTRASVNNSSRSEMAAHAKNRDLLNGSIVTGGTPNAQTFTSGVGYATTIPTGLRATLKIGAGLTNTASATLNMDGIGDTLIKTDIGENLKGGELRGGCYTDFLYNGTNWIFLYSREFFQNLIDGGDGVIIGKQIFSTAGTFTYTPTVGMESCILEVCGGGGGGGAVWSNPSFGLRGSGGGSGGYSQKTARAADIGGSQVVIVGAGGAGGVPNGPTATEYHAGSGGASSVGSLCTANGGQGGIQSDQSFSQLIGGNGGAAGTGDCVAGGSAGIGGQFSIIGDGGSAHNVTILGQGGPSYFGGGGQSGNQNGAGSVGSAYGAGGGGAGAYTQSGMTLSGGAGAAGVVIITEFSGRGAPGRDGTDGATGPVGPPGPAGPGTGDVLVHGTPVAGQIAQWFDTSHIQGVDASIFTTGDAKITLKTVADAGWVMMDDGTIGSASSGSSTRANTDTQALFTLLFNNCNDTYAPILTSAGAATTRATQGTAATAWAANCRMSLTRQLGRSLSIAGSGNGLTNCALGQFDGEERHAQTIAEMASHDHQINADSTGGIGTTNYVAGGPVATTNNPRTQVTGGGVPMPVIHPRSFWNIMIKL